MIILGASARAAAASALRAGFQPWCADLFADADLARACPVRQVAAADYPRALIAAAREAPSAPWIYTGALENRPGIVAQVDRPLWGNPAEVLRRVRSPFLVETCLRRRGLACPAVCADLPARSRGRRYIVKPIRSGGGARIRFLDADVEFNRSQCYLQEWIEGNPCSAVFVADADRRAHFFGATRQLIGASWLHAAPFQWCGNVGPLALPESTTAKLALLGQVLVEEFGLRGLFGVDFILQDDIPWPVEVNPRYTGAVEVLERATGQALLAHHARAFAAGSPQHCNQWGGARIVGKAILFAPATIVFPQHGPWDEAANTRFDDPAVPFADIPAPGTHIDRGQPICTVFATGDSEALCLARLRERVREVLACALGRWGGRG